MISYTDSKFALYWKKFVNSPKSKLDNEILKQLKIDVNKYEPLIFNYGKTTFRWIIK